MIEKTLLEISKNFLNLNDKCSDQIHLASRLMVDAINNNKKIMFCGNGGSAADSQHLSAELIGRYRKNRRPLPSISLTTDTSSITAISNDFTFDDIFSRQIEALGVSGDILYAISTSGKSRNIINAINVAKKREIIIIGITGANGNEMNDLCDVLIKVPAKRPDRIQEMHIAVGHMLCEIIESTIC